MRHWGLAGAVLLLVLVVGSALALSRPGVTQPLPFNHRLHIEEVGAECGDCHLYATTGARATIPKLQVCADCHEEPIGESPEEAWLVERILAGEPVEWQKVYTVPDHVFFSHRRHTAVAEIPCSQCHGEVELLDEPPSRPLVSLTMAACMDCHDERGAANDCILCHW